MNPIVSWRGQVPVWQCDASGRWNMRHVLGAFDEATRICAAGGTQAGAVSCTLDPQLCPQAGTLVEIRSWLAQGRLVHAMITLPDGSELCHASAISGATRLAVAEQTPAPGAIRGPLNIVNSWECDVMGHMNVQFYASRLTEAEALFGSTLGVVALRPIQHRFRFVGELRAGDVAAAATMRIEGEASPLTARTEITRNGELCAAMESDLAFDERLGGETKPTVGAAIGAVAISGPFDPVWSSGDWSPDEETLARMTVLGRQEVAAWEVDHYGAMPPRFFFARMASSVPFLLEMMGLGRSYMASRGLGRAAVGYRLRYLRWPRIGDCLELRSGVALVGEKSWRFRHRFIDVADGARICVVEAVIVLFDLAARRAVALSDAVRQKALSVAI